MDELKEQALKTTEEIREQRTKRDEEFFNSQKEKLGPVLDALTNQILAACRDENTENNPIRRAYERGFGKTNIFSYTPQDKFQDYPVIFLLKGPRSGPFRGLEFYRHLGLTPVIDRITEELKPFGVYHWYPGRNRNVIEVTWADTSASMRRRNFS